MVGNHVLAMRPDQSITLLVAVMVANVCVNQTFMDSTATFVNLDSITSLTLAAKVRLLGTQFNFLM